MSTISIKTEALKEALKSYDKKVSVEVKEGKMTNIPLSESNSELLTFISEKLSLTKSQKLKIKGFFSSEEKLAATEAGSVTDFFNTLLHVSTSAEPLLELKINDKWYPVLVSLYKFRTFGGSSMVEVNAYASIGSLQYSKINYVGDWVFEDNTGNPVKKTISDILKDYNLRVASKESVSQAKKLNAKLLEMNGHANAVYDASGFGLTYHDWFGWQDFRIGWEEAPSTVVIEPSLEDRYHGRANHNTTWSLPFVRIFSMKHKQYLYVDIGNLKEHVFHQEGREKIVLPEKMRVALNSIFNAKQDAIFGDLFHGRHGGIVVLANGPSGVGKTLTAEVFAEYQKRPLYTMEMGEIGTSLKEVEANLQRIFARAKKWNAVLLFDEADIFLSERVASDLERSAIVGIFLRLLDYYEGTFFLTTNRGDGIDKAFKSRVTLYLDYPELSPEIRKIIWTNMLGAAAIEVTEDASWDVVSKAPLNGRQIRNQVRLLKLMYPDNKVKTSSIMESLEFTTR
jgi:hypothetical protein